MSVPRSFSESCATVEPPVEDLLRELAEARGDYEKLLYAISHDLQSPVRGIAGFARILKERGAGDLGSEGEEFLGFILQGAEQLQSMIHGLLQVCRVGSRGRPFEPVPIETLLGDVLAGLESRLDACGALVRFGELPVLAADADQMTQALHCLVENALDFRGERSPVIEVSADRSDDGWEFSVRDNGRGFDPAQSARILDIFVRLNPEAESGRVGVGLALCRRIIERHGGRLWAETEPGIGSTFRFHLPDAIPAPPAG